jgi:hypothetical protein
LDIEFLPQISLSVGEYRYAWQAMGTNAADPYFFGRLDAKSVSATIRTSYSFTPALTLQTYAQGFLASGHYNDPKEVPRSLTGQRITLSDLGSATNAAAPGADFEEAALNINVILRWEYHLGSTLFLVYSRSQVPSVKGFVPPAMIDFHALQHGASSDVILFKLSYWWAS